MLIFIEKFGMFQYHIVYLHRETSVAGLCYGH